MKAYLAKLKALNACPEALARLARTTQSPQEAWDACERGDRMLWLLGRLTGPPMSDARRPLTLCCCEVARGSLAQVPDGEDRPRMAIELAERWAAGEHVSRKELEQAASAAWSALSAARSAAASTAWFAASAASAARSTAASAASAARSAESAASAALSAASAAASTALSAASTARSAALSAAASAARSAALSAGWYAAWSAAESASLKASADIVRKHFPVAPDLKEA